MPINLTAERLRQKEVNLGYTVRPSLKKKQLTSCFYCAMCSFQYAISYNIYYAGCSFTFNFQYVTLFKTTH